MAKLPWINVNSPTIRQLAEKWAEISDQDAEFITSEMQLAWLNLQRMEDGLPMLAPEEIPPYDELPSPNERINKDWLLEFCDKQDWPYPKFWSDDNEPEAVRPQGRPSIKQEVVNRFRERANAGLTKETISEEAREVEYALRRLNIYDNIPEAKTIQGHIRDEFNKKT
ncbi:MAG: hypothetical protein ABJO72_05005 [Hyphomicrobiales bacterium]